MSKIQIYTPHNDKPLWWISGYNFTPNQEAATTFDSKEDALTALQDEDRPPYDYFARHLDEV